MTRALQLIAAALFLLLVVLGLVRRRRTAPLRLASGPAEGVLTDDGIRLHVEEDGDPHADVTVVFSHGFTARLGEFDLQREALRSRARLVLYDQRGHGRSPLGSPAKATIEQLGRDLAAVVAQRAPTGPVLLVGHSMGGMTVMTFARQHPEVVRSRVIGAFLLATSAEEVVSSGAVGRTVGLLTRLGLLTLWLRVLRLSAPLMERSRMRGTFAARLLFEKYLFGCDDATPEHVREVQDMLEETPYTTTTAFYPSFITHDERESLPVLAPLPVTVLVGECDRITPATNSVRMAEALGPNARLVVVPGAGHSVNLTRREVVDRELVDLLERARRSSAVA